MNTEELRDKFVKEIDVADWSMLEPHYERGVIVVVSPVLDLINVAIAVAEDNVEAVKAWMDDGTVQNATEEHAESWKVTPYEKMAEFLIVQPYVLVQELESRTH